MPVLSSIQLQLYTPPKIFFLDVTQDVDGLDDPTKRGECLGQAIGGTGAGQSLNYYFRWCVAVLERRRHAHHLIPLLIDQVPIGGAVEQLVKGAIVPVPVQFVELLVCQVFDSRHEFNTKQVA